MNDRSSQVGRVTAASFPSLGFIGFVVWLVFLVLKLCNQTNPDFEWLTWFWVWFPFWLPFAIEGAFIILLIPIVILIYRLS